MPGSRSGRVGAATAGVALPSRGIRQQVAVGSYLLIRRRAGQAGVLGTPEARHDARQFVASRAGRRGLAELPRGMHLVAGDGDGAQRDRLGTYIVGQRVAGAQPRCQIGTIRPPAWWTASGNATAPGHLGVR